MFAHIPRFQSWSTRGKHAYGIIAHHGKPGSTLRRSKRYFQSAGCRLVESSECRRSLPKKKRPLRGAYFRSPRMAWDRNVSAGTSTDLAHRLHRRGASLASGETSMSRYSHNAQISSEKDTPVGVWASESDSCDSKTQQASFF